MKKQNRDLLRSLSSTFEMVAELLYNVSQSSLSTAFLQDDVEKAKVLAEATLEALKNNEDKLWED